MSRMTRERATYGRPEVVMSVAGVSARSVSVQGGETIIWMGYSLVVQASWVPALKSFPLSPKTRRLKLASMAIHDDDA